MPASSRCAPRRRGRCCRRPPRRGGSRPLRAGLRSGRRRGRAARGPRRGARSGRRPSACSRADAAEARAASQRPSWASSPCRSGRAWSRAWLRRRMRRRIGPSGRAAPPRRRVEAGSTAWLRPERNPVSVSRPCSEPTCFVVAIVGADATTSGASGVGIAWADSADRFGASRERGAEGFDAADAVNPPGGSSGAGIGVPPAATLVAGHASAAMQTPTTTESRVSRRDDVHVGTPRPSLSESHGTSVDVHVSIRWSRAAAGCPAAALRLCISASSSASPPGSRGSTRPRAGRPTSPVLRPGAGRSRGPSAPASGSGRSRRG